MSLEGTIARLKKANREAESERAKIDNRWSAEERRKREREIGEALASRAEELRQEGLEALTEERQEARARRHKAQLAAGPVGAEQWAEARARLTFIAEDVAELEPGEVPEVYRAAVAAGDRLGAWLIGREAKRHLAAVGSAEAIKALAELEKLDGGQEIEQRYKEDQREIDGLWRDLLRLIPSARVGRPPVQF